MNMLKISGRFNALALTVPLTALLLVACQDPYVKRLQPLSVLWTAS